jgi:hypothetical protein
MLFEAQWICGTYSFRSGKDWSIGISALIFQTMVMEFVEAHAGIRANEQRDNGSGFGVISVHCRPKYQYFKLVPLLSKTERYTSRGVRKGLVLLGRKDCAIFRFPLSNAFAASDGRQSLPACIPRQSLGTRKWGTHA